MRLLKSIELYTWLLVNILLPIVAPLCFVLLMNILIYTGKDWIAIIKMLWEGGAYIFLSLFVLISLLPHFFGDFPIHKKSVVFVYILLLLVVLGITCFLYLSYLSLIQGSYAVPFSENIQLSINVTILGIIIAIIFKAYFLLEKTNDNYISDQDTPIYD